MRREKSAVLLEYKTFDPRARNDDDKVWIRRHENVHHVFSLKDEGRLEALAEGKAIYTGPH
jgi:hypothetical protein